ncbi:MAG: BMC domain-containing protein [Kiritimatiellia bacterium]
MTCLAGLETSFISVTALVADAMVKAADIRLLGFEPTGIETILIRIAADSPDSLQAALDAGRFRASELGIPEPSEVRIARPDEALFHLNDNPNNINGIYGGREEMRPDDHPPSRPENPNMKNKSIGILETQGLTAVLEGTDAMLKAADVQLVGKEKIGAAYVAITISGDVAAVNAAIEACATAVGGLGKLIAAHVIARPHDDLLKILPTL